MIRVQWANPEKTILHWHFSHRWSRLDFTNACQQSVIMMKPEHHTIHLIADVSASRNKPLNIIHIALEGMRRWAGNTGKILIVSPSKLWSDVYQYIVRVYPHDVVPVQFVNTIDDAMKLLEQPVK